MFTKKRKIVFVLALLLVFTTILSSAYANEVSAESGEEILVNFSHNQPITSPEHAGAEKFKEVAESMSDGKIKVQLYPAGQMGSLREQVEGVQLGTTHISMQPSAVITPFVDDIKVLDLPYLWPSDREVIYEVLDGEMGRELLDRLENKGFHGLGYWFGGYKLFTTEDIEIHVPSDFEGVKMRVMESPLLLSQYQAWGGTPVALPYAELYNGLQQGIVDGQENPLQTIYLNNFHEVQNQIIESYHGGMMYVMISNKAWFDGLSENIQNIITKAEKEGRKEAREVLLETEKEYVENIKETGVNYYKLMPEEIEKFTKASKTVHEEHYDTEWQKDYLNRLYDAIEEASK